MSGVGDCRARASARIAGGVVLGLALLAWWCVSLRASGTFQDLAVYRTGAQAIASGLSPYAARAHGHGDLVFTYPPFAGVVFVPLTWIPAGIASTVLVLGSALSYALVVAAAGRRLGWSPRAIAAALVLGLAAAPIVRTVQQGQINLLLAAMIAADVWLLPRRWRGVLIGIAAGIKIVPAVFVLYAVARRDWRSAARTVAAGMVTIGVAWAVAPEASLRYWTQMALDTSRSGGGGYPDNQSLVGVLARVLGDNHPPVWATLPLQGAALGLAYLCARRALKADRPVEGALAVAVGGLLASPISWSHHWVWCVPLVMTLVTLKKNAHAVLAAIVFAIPPLAFSPVGLLDSAPPALWVTATALLPTMGVAWLVIVARHHAAPTSRGPVVAGRRPQEPGLVALP